MEAWLCLNFQLCWKRCGCENKNTRVVCPPVVAGGERQGRCRSPAKLHPCSWVGSSGVSESPGSQPSLSCHPLGPFQVPPCSPSSAPTTRSSTSSSSTLSPSLASSSSPSCWCASRAGTPARTPTGRMGCPCCGSRNHTSTTPQLAWSPLCSVSTQEP